MKTCTKCGETKPTTEFHLRRRSWDGFRPSCKRCIAAYGARRYAHDSPRHKAIQRRSRLKLKYGLDEAAWDAMLIAQAGRCAICTDPMLRPQVDHCHTTGDVRGLLCRGCNQGIGLLRDDPVRLQAAVLYLKP